MPNIAARHLALLIVTAFTLFFMASTPASTTAITILGEKAPQGFDPETGNRIIPNERCLKCHGDEHQKTETRDDGSVVEIFIEPDKIKASVHGKRNCTGCHNTITRVPHREAPEVVVSCMECHRKTWEKHKDDPNNEFKRLGVVIEQIEKFNHSVHARGEDEDDPTDINANCYDCHDAHNIGTLGSIQRAEHRLKNPEVCGDCHKKELNKYKKSVHGKAVLEDGNSDSAVCSDCHTNHEIDSPEGDKVMLSITKNCGDCHEEAQKTYRSSYHGQVNKLGYTNTAKCYDCHGSHELGSVDDPTSTIHLDNRLETCQTCHEDAPENFIGFHPHGNANDFDKYPVIWITSKFMQLLIISVLAFFWIHVLLWFYREHMDRKAGKSYSHPKPGDDTLYVRRFSASWRWIHLLFAVSTMILALSGTTLLFSHTAWASTIMGLLGGPKIEAIIHRTAATIWLTVFLIHFGIAMTNIWRNRATFRWFGPNSMIPNMQDLRDVGAMFSWFFGRRERPNFDRFTYWQKFDYWAPFWGAAVIGFSGLMLFVPTVTAIFLPGWVFNIATIVHAEEALLATVFLFTVHFFNSHFRPDRFPMSTIMFTGAVPLEEFKFEHRLEYERLKASGELDKILIKPPSKAMETGSRALAAVLIIAGLGLLTLVFIGYMTMPH
jgi:cytochrome b subunit of formate dehydrogenase